MTTIKDEITLLNGKVKFHMCKKQDNEVLKILSDIINRLSTNQHQQDVELKDYLMFALIDRINLNFNESKTAIHNDNMLNDFSKLKLRCKKKNEQKGKKRKG
ncbi:unnamed protein product [Rotaria sp. Silwood1]|nr:unnamed protein product [Rotaria sp. Silwood1]CAF5036251.1 unnamed protein product [Rotaria sp. Silwood1]